MLADKDRGHLIKFRDFLRSTHAITSVPRQPGGWGTGSAARYSVRSRELHDRLKGLGVRGPELSPDLTVSRHFWRGVVDGDGWVGDHRMELVGYPYVVRPFAAFLGENGIPEPSVRPHKSIERVQLGGATAVSALRLLYADCSVALERKHINAAQNIVAAAGLAASACRGDVRRHGATRPQSPVKQELPRVTPGIPVLQGGE
jgi:hypothetical protein